MGAKVGCFGRAGALGFRGYPGVSVAFGGQIMSNLTLGSQFLGFSWVSGVSVGLGRQISCKSQGNLTLRSQFLGFSWVSGGIRFACGQNHFASESKIAREMLCFTIETVVGGCEGRMFRTSGCVGFSWVSGGIRCFRWSNYVKSLANHRVILL